MRYSNTSYEAIMELESQRTGDYGYDYEDERTDDRTDEWLYERDED